MQFKMTISEYATWILKKYSELKEQPAIYRIVEINKTVCEQYQLIIQVIGKSSIIKCKPQEVLADDGFLEGFSKKDIRMITYLACSRQLKYTIATQELNQADNKILFTLKSCEDDSFILKSAQEIVSDKKLLNSLSTEDISSISYIAGYECSY